MSSGAPGQSWREKLTSGASMLKQKASAATVVMVDAAEKAGQRGKTAMDAVKDNWNTKVQPKVAPTLTRLKTSIIATKDKVVASKYGQQVSQTSKEVAIRAREALTKLRTRGPGGENALVFGVPLEVVVQRQRGARPVPAIVLHCTDYLVNNGLLAELIFKKEADNDVVTRLVRLYDTDSTTAIPEGTSPFDVATLLSIYLRTLPEPVLTHELYDDLAGGKGRTAGQMRELVATLPAANQATLECVVSLLLRISRKSIVNKMDARALARELAPALVWPKGYGVSASAGTGSPAASTSSPSAAPGAASPSTGPQSPFMASSTEKPPAPSPLLSSPKPTPAESSPVVSLQNGLEREDPPHLAVGDGNMSPAEIPLDNDDEEQGRTAAAAAADAETGAVEDAVECLIAHHDEIFADASEAVWQELKLQK